MRAINKIIIYCSATPEGKDVQASEIRRWHMKGNGWSDIGYHYVIHLDGSIHPGRPETRPGAHCSGHNADSIGVCYVGGLSADGKTPKDTRTPAQCAAIDWLVDDLLSRYRTARVYGHNQLDPGKACPSYKVN